jgi:hypothetical protein
MDEAEGVETGNGTIQHGEAVLLPPSSVGTPLVAFSDGVSHGFQGKQYASLENGRLRRRYAGTQPLFYHGRAKDHVHVILIIFYTVCIWWILHKPIIPGAWGCARYSFGNELSP